MKKAKKNVGINADKKFDAKVDKHKFLWNLDVVPPTCTLELNLTCPCI